MGVRPRILVVHSQPARVAWIASGLGEDLETVSAGSAEEAWPQLTGGVKLVVAEEKVGVAFLEELARRAPGTPRAILLNGGDRRPWLDAAAEGFAFVGVSEAAPDVPTRLRAMVTAQAEPKTLRGCSAEVAVGGAVVLVGPVLQLTSETLAIRLEPGEALEALLPGQELERVVVRRAQDILLECPGTIRGLRPDSAGGFEIDVVLTAPSAPPQRAEVVRDWLQRASLVGEALRVGGLKMRRADGAGEACRVRGRIDAAAELLLIDTAQGFAAGTGVLFTFDSGGAHYEFFGALAEPGTTPDSLAVALPGELQGRRRRRVRTALGGAVALETAIERPLVDIELEGMGFLADPGDLLPVGARVVGMRVDLEGGVRLRATGRIASRAAGAGPDGRARVRCGVQFDPLSPEDQSALAAAVLRSRYPGLEVARGLTFDALWCFLRECGFLYPEKEEKILPVLPEVSKTVAALLAHPDGPLRTLVFRSHGLLQGHVSTLRAYRRTWVLQHLATRKDGPGRLDAARALGAGVMEYLEQLPDAEWFRIWYRPQNRFPARTFGRFGRIIYDPNRSEMRVFQYLTAHTDAPGPVVKGVEVLPASAADWAEIRRALVGLGQSAALAAEDLCQAPDLCEVDDAYAALGLSRRREALVARRDGRLVGFALVEISSLGLNLSELTNAFRLHLLEPDPGVTTALVQAAKDRYRALGRPLAIGLAEAPDLAAWQAAGFTRSKEYCCWTLHRSFFKRGAEYMNRLYDHLPAGARRRG